METIVETTSGLTALNSTIAVVSLLALVITAIYRFAVNVILPGNFYREVIAFAASVTIVILIGVELCYYLTM